MQKSVYEQYNILIESRLTKLETIIEEHEKTFNGIDNKFNKIDDKFNRIDDKFNRLEDKIDKHFYWTIGLILISILMPYINSILKAKGLM